MLALISMVYSAAVPEQTRSGVHQPGGVGYAANSGLQRHEEEPS
jgi:hypothetical protein